MPAMFGYPITQLESTQTVECNDLFCAATKDIYIKKAYESKCISFQDIVQYIADLANDMLGLGSMAYQESSMYSLKDHNHSNLYNSLSIDIAYLPNDDKIVSETSLSSTNYEFTGYPVIATVDNALSIGNIFFNGILSTLCIPLSSVAIGGVVPWQIIEPSFGEIKFIACPQIDQHINYQSDDFDGWLWMNSKIQYELQYFRLSNLISSNPLPDFIKSINNDGTFCIKDLSTFVSIDNHSQRFMCNDGYECTPSHHHSCGANISGVVTAVGTARVGEIAGNGGLIHDGNGLFASKFDSELTARSKKVFGNKNAVKIGSSYKLTSLTLSGHPEQSWRDIYHALGGCVTTEAIEITAQCLLNTSNPINTQLNDSIKSYPSHNLMPAMVYVGRKKGF